MPLLSALSAALTTKAAAGLATAALVGGGVAIAVDRPDLPVEGETADAQVSELPGVVVEPELPTLPEPAEDRHVPDPDDLTPDLDGLVPDPDEASADAGERGVSDEVHGALTGNGEDNGEEPPSPGDDGFGETVAENARDNGREFGQNVAAAASDGASEVADERRAEPAQGSGDQAEERDGNADEAPVKPLPIEPEPSEQAAEQVDAGAANADDHREDQDRPGR